MRATASAVTLAVVIGAILGCGTDTAGGATRHVHAGDSIAAAVRKAEAGDTIVVHRGRYPSTRIVRGFSAPVLIQAALGETVRVERFWFASGARNVTVQGFLVQPRDHETEAIALYDGTRDITIAQNTIVGGYDGIRFSADRFADWPVNIRIVRNDISRAFNDNIEINGARDVTIEQNWIHDPRVNGRHNDGIQSLASDGLTIRGNEFSFRGRGPNGPNQGIILGRPVPPLPGKRVTRSAIVNNLIHDWWGTGLTLSGTQDTLVVNNTIVDSGLPRAPGASLLLASRAVPGYANEDVRLVNNVLHWLKLGARAQRPAVETHNLVRVGGHGPELIRADPLFLDRVTYALSSRSPAVDSADAAWAPDVDRMGRPRDGTPDRGADEVGTHAGAAFRSLTGRGGAVRAPLRE